MKKILNTCIFITIVIISGCITENTQYKFIIENTENGILTYVGGKIYYHKIYSLYKIENVGNEISENALLKINILLNNKVIYQEIFEIEPIQPNYNITKKLSYTYDKHKEDNVYKLVAEIIVNNKKIISIENFVSN